MDIAFGDCVSVGGYRFALILVDRATRYNWAFGLKTLSSSCILLTLRLFRAAASTVIVIINFLGWPSVNILSIISRRLLPLRPNTSLLKDSLSLTGK